MRQAAFTHLHLRSGFSYGCGTAVPEELVSGAVEAGMDSLALTDRDGLYGVPRFLRAAEEAGVATAHIPGPSIASLRLSDCISPPLLPTTVERGRATKKRQPGCLIARLEARGFSSPPRGRFAFVTVREGYRPGEQKTLACVLTPPLAGRHRG